MSCIESYKEQFSINSYWCGSQLNYSKGTSWELGCNYAVSHHSLQYATDKKNIFRVWWLNQCQSSALKRQDLNKKGPMWLFIVIVTTPLTFPFQNHSSFWSTSFVAYIQLLSDISHLENLQGVCFSAFFPLLLFFLISSCQKWLALSKNCRRALWHFLLLQASAVETRLVQGLM